MLSEVLGFIGGIFKPAADLIDEVHTSEEEKLTLKAKLAAIEASISAKFVEYATRIAELQSQIIQTETNSQSWLARNWRPLAMLNFLFIINLYWFGYQPAGLSEDTLQTIFELIKWGLGGYVVGRSVEKTASKVADIVKSK